MTVLGNAPARPRSVRRCRKTAPPGEIENPSGTEAGKEVVKLQMTVKPQETDGRAYGCEEFGRLTSVLVHTPGDELGLITEDNHDRWLFDAVPDVEGFIREHESYCELLRSRGVEVNQLRDHVKDTAGLVLELPNLTYLHDVAVITTHGAILSRMFMPARRREEVVVKEALLEMGIPVWFEFTDPDDGFEGCLLLSPDTVLVAHTERHTSASIRKFIRQAASRFRDVIFVDIPKARRYMHPDTIYNRVDFDLALAYMPAFERTWLFRDGVARDLDFREYVSRRGIELIEVSDREQERLACTFVPLEPGVVFHYDTALDASTVRKLSRRGVELILFHPDALRAGGGSLRCITLRLNRLTAGGPAPGP